MHNEVTGAAMFLQSLARLDPLVLALVDLVFMLVLWKLGFRSAQRKSQKAKGESPAHANAIAQGCLALVSLLLAFTYAASYARHESRRLEALDEANAIGTFGTRLKLLPENLRDPALQQLRHYVELHRKVIDSTHSRAERMAIDQEILEIQNKFVLTITTYLRTPEGQPLTVVMMPALNAVLDNYEKLVNGIVTRVPTTAILLLLLVSFFCAFLIGRSEGYTYPRQWWGTGLLLALFALVLYVSLDLDQPWRGLSRLSDEPMKRLATSLGGK